MHEMICNCKENFEKLANKLFQASLDYTFTAMSSILPLSLSQVFEDVVMRSDLDVRVT